MTSYDQFNTYYKPEEWQRCQNNWDEYIDFRDKRRRKKHDYKNPMFARYHPNPHWLPYYNWFWFVEHLFTRTKMLPKDVAKYILEFYQWREPNERLFLDKEFTKRKEREILQNNLQVKMEIANIAYMS